MQVVQRLLNSHNRVTQQPNSLVALLAKQPANFSVTVPVVNHKLDSLPAAAAFTILDDQPRRVFNAGDSIPRGELFFALTAPAPIAQPILLPAVLSELRNWLTSTATFAPPPFRQSWALQCVITVLTFRSL